MNLPEKKQPNDSEIRTRDHGFLQVIEPAAPMGGRNSHCLSGGPSNHAQKSRDKGILYRLSGRILYLLFLLIHLLFLLIHLLFLLNMDVDQNPRTS